GDAVAPQRGDDAEGHRHQPREAHCDARHEDRPPQALADDAPHGPVGEEAEAEVAACDDAADPAQVLLVRGPVEAELLLDAGHLGGAHARVLQVAVGERPRRDLDDEEADDRHQEERRDHHGHAPDHVDEHGASTPSLGAAARAGSTAWSRFWPGPPPGSTRRLPTPRLWPASALAPST